MTDDKSAAEIVNDNALWEAECARLLTPEGMRSFEYYARGWGVLPETALKAAQNRCRLLAKRAIAAGKDVDLPDLLERPLDNLDITAVKRAAVSLVNAPARAAVREQDREQDAEDAKLAVERGLQPWKKTGLKGSTREVLYMLLGDHDYAERVSETYGDVGVQSRTDTDYVYARWELRVGDTLTTAKQKSRGGWIVVPSRRIESAEPVTVVGGQTIWRAKLGEYVRTLTEPSEPANEP